MAASAQIRTTGGAYSSEYSEAYSWRILWQNGAGSPTVAFTMTEVISVVQENGVVSLFFNRPERKNALSQALLGQLDDALSSRIGDETSAVIIGGIGGVFSAGADLADLTGTRSDLAIDDAIEAVTEKIRQLPFPVIAPPKMQ